MLLESEYRKEEPEELFKTVYVGGGTPSVLSPDLFRKLSDGLRHIFNLNRVEEFTVEANPGTVTAGWLDTVLESGVNRLSLGMQSNQPHLLSLLGRIHQFSDVRDTVSAARKSGFRNINIDLIFGIPGQSLRDWTETLDAALSLEPEHISAYGLIPEEDTPLFTDLSRGKIHLPDPEDEREMYAAAIELFRRHGLIQYEISNFSKKGFECRHNIGYWTQIPYMGLGLSAASMTDIRIAESGMSYIRRTNPDSLDVYRNMVFQHSGPAFEEKISPAEARFETVMLSLRMNRGIGDQEFSAMHGRTMEDCYGKKLQDLVDKGLIQHKKGRWFLTPRGFDIQNSILVEFMD